MDLVALTLGSPRGRFLCANVAYMCSTDEQATRYGRPRSPEDAREVIEAVDVAAVAELSEMDLLDAFGHATDVARYWQPPDEEDVMFARPDIAASLHPIATAVLASRHAAWWGEPVDHDSQRMVAHPPARVQWPESTAPYRRSESDLDQWREHVLKQEAWFREHRSAHPARSVDGEWWSTPATSNTLVTSRARGGIGALELLLEEDSSGGGEARVWPVSIRNSPRVYEISNPTDWAALVDAYPLAVPESRRSVWFETTGEYRDWFIPDWAAVAEDYDAAHLSLHGYLSTPGIAIPLSENAGATVLAGWDPDTTWWFGDDAAFIDDEPSLWRRQDGRWEKV